MSVIGLPRLVLSFLVISCLTACGDGSSDNKEQPTHEISEVESPEYLRLEQAASEPQNWLTHGGTYDEQRFSPLTQINADNVSDLGLGWYFDLDTQRGQEATPIVVDGKMYVSTAWSKVKALNAVTGELLWEYDPQVDRAWAVNACCDVVNRGVAFWDGQVFIGTLDGYLVALDAQTGAENWKVLTIDKSKSYTITGAPRVVKGKVLIGNGGAEFGVRGYLSAYDHSNGELVWRFHTVPGEPAKGFENDAMKMAADTWTGEWWKLGGGGTVWDSMAYDPELDLLYIGVGNGSPWNQAIRSPEGGDNLFLSSIVALRPDSGDYVWHFQTTPGETWDFTATQQITLADLEIAGETRKVLMQAPKNGFFYVLDRATGEFISGKPFATVNWAFGLDQNGRPIPNPEARYDQTGKLFLVMPGPSGAHNWHSMSYSPQSGLVYIPVHDMAFPMLTDTAFKPLTKAWNLGLDLISFDPPSGKEEVAAVVSTMQGYLLAWDPIKQSVAWRFKHQGVSNGGALSTAGNLVFQGTAKGQFNAFGALDGALKWSYPSDTGIIAAPVSYEVDGTQYVAIVVGWGGVFGLGHGDLSKAYADVRNNSRVLVFKLGGKAQLPTSVAYKENFVAPPKQIGRANDIAQGKVLYSQYCAACHGAKAIGGGLIQDIRYGGPLHDATLWNQVVLEGLYENKGMASFKSEFGSEQAAVIRSYVISVAQEGAMLESK